MKDRITRIFCERSFSSEDIPKNFYLALNLSLGDERGEKLIDDLNRGVLEGVKGIGGSSMKEMIKDWGNMREVLVIMKSEDVMKINKVTRVMYDNPEYLLSNGMRALRRLFAETSEEYTSIFTKMQDYLLKVMDDVKVKGWISHNGAINELSYVKGLSKKVNNSYDLAKILMNNMKSDYCKDKGIEWWRKVVVDGIKLMGNLYSSEKEWMIKDGIFNIPSNSRIVVVESEYYKKEWQKRNGEDKFASRMANSTAVSNYDQFLHLIDKLKSKWGERVSIVSEKWVNDNKLKLIKSGR